MWKNSKKPAPLINMATGVVAPDEVTKELLTGKDLGRMALKNYVEHCLQDQDISMIKPIKRSNLLTGKELGRMALKDYVKHCLQDQDISMIKPIKRLNLKTFATMERFSAKGNNKPKPFPNQTGNYLDGSWSSEKTGAWI